MKKVNQEKKVKKVKKTLQSLDVVLDFGLGSRDRDVDRGNERGRDGCDGIFQMEKDQLFNF